MNDRQVRKVYGSRYKMPEDVSRIESLSEEIRGCLVDIKEAPITRQVYRSAEVEQLLGIPALRALTKGIRVAVDEGRGTQLEEKIAFLSPVRPTLVDHMMLYGEERYRTALRFLKQLSWTKREQDVIRDMLPEDATETSTQNQLGISVQNFSFYRVQVLRAMRVWDDRSPRLIHAWRWPVVILLRAYRTGQTWAEVEEMYQAAHSDWANLYGLAKETWEARE